MFPDDCRSVPLRVGLSPAIPNVGERVFTVLRLHLGARVVPVPASAADHSGRLHGRNRTSGRKDKRNTSVRAVTRGFGYRRNFPCPLPSERVPPCLSGSRKLTVLPYTSPARMSLPWETGVPGSPEGFFFPHPASNRPLTGMTDRAFFPKLIGKTLTKVGGGESKSAKMPNLHCG